MITLYDYELSGSCYKVRLLLHILGVEYQSHPLDFVERAHKGTEFLTLNPFGELPVLEDDGVRLRDAQAILVYVARKYDRSGLWYPDDAASMGLIAQWLATGGGELMSISAARLVKALNYPLDLDRLHESANRVLGILDQHLATRAFLELGRATIADIACFPYAALACEGGIDLQPYGNVVAWTQRMRQIERFIPMPGILPAMRT
jgi:glutathione S-transferase